MVEIAKGIGIALITTFICLIIFSVILTYTSINDNCIDPVIMVVTGLSILLGSFLGNMKIRKNGMLNGGIVGVAYLLILYFISSMLNWQFGLNAQSIIMIIVGTMCGILGGVLGVNKKQNNKKSVEKTRRMSKPVT